MAAYQPQQVQMMPQQVQMMPQPMAVQGTAMYAPQPGMMMAAPGVMAMQQPLVPGQFQTTELDCWCVQATQAIRRSAQAPGPQKGCGPDKCPRTTAHTRAPPTRRSGPYA